jgi:hypothetical protein
MDSEKKHQIIKEAFSSETLLNLKTIIDDVYEGLTFEEKNNFLIHLEFEFLVNIKKEIKSSKANIGLFRLTGYYDKVVSFDNNKKQNYKFLLKWVKEKKAEDITNEFSQIDLSDTNATEKIIYLHELGIIDFLRTKQPFNTSINSLATVLSAITGVKPETKHIQSMLNPIISKEAGQKNNPLNSKKTVSKVQNQLINIGFNLNKTI